MNGMGALQAALKRRVREERIDWMNFDWTFAGDTIPWIWCWEQRPLAVHVARSRWPFVVGPNVFFLDTRQPRCDAAEAAILDASSCEAIFCHASWYRDLIRANMGPENRAEIWSWPYPIEPKPGPPVTPAGWDVLVVVKSGPRIEELIGRAASRFDRITVLHYGSFERQALFDTARRARSCLYLSDDESGGLVTQEIMLAGCPVAGIERGAPLVEHGRTGARVATWTADEFIAALERCLDLDRTAVRRAALEAFDTDRIVSRVIGYLDDVRRRW